MITKFSFKETESRDPVSGYCSVSRLVVRESKKFRASSRSRAL